MGAIRLALEPGREARMKCPRCTTSLVTRTVAELEVEECPSCNGLWLEAGTLRRLKDEADPDLAWLDFELWKHPERFEITERPIRCPSCDIPLAAVEYGDTGVTVDFCTRCRGVWLDEDELGRIVDRLSEELLDKDVSEYLRATLAEAKELITGPEGRLSEWRDLATVLRFLQYRVLSEHSRFASLLAEFQAKSQF